MCLLLPYLTPFQLSQCEQMSSQLTSTPRRERGKSASQGGGGGRQLPTRGWNTSEQLSLDPEEDEVRVWILPWDLIRKVMIVLLIIVFKNLPSLDS